MGKKKMIKRSKKIVLNRPVPSTRRDKKMMVFVKNPRTNRIKKIHFGQPGFPHNQSKEARRKYLLRSAGRRDGKGRLTKNNPLTANYWSRVFLWNAPKRRKSRNKKWRRFI